MSTLNPLTREVNVKVVYYGPGLSGKTTSLKRLYQQLKPESRGELVSLATEGDRTLFFDYLPVHLERVNDLSVRLQVYTVPGQVFYEATRKLVLNGADGVVFVADSQRAAMDSNAESMGSLRGNLAELGLDLDQFPLVIQYNKRDLANALPVAQLRAALNPRQRPEVESVAEKGQGVYPAFKEAVRQILAGLRARPQSRRARPTPTPIPLSANLAFGSATPEITLTDFRIPPELLAPRPPAELPPPAGLSLAPLAPGAEAGVREVEGLIAEKQHGPAVQAAAGHLARLLEKLPSTDANNATRAALLGLDGLEYLRLCRLAGQPNQAVREADALFALHFYVGAALRAARLG